MTTIPQDNCNIFLVLHDEATGSLADRAALFSAGCALAAVGHILLILGYGQSSHLAEARTTAQHPNGRDSKAYDSEMAAQHPPAFPAGRDHAPPV